MWLTLLFRQGQADGRINEGMSIGTLQGVLSGDTKADVLKAIAHAAHKAHRTLKGKPQVSAERVENIVSQVLRASISCQSLHDTQLHALLEMLPIYMQVMGYVSGDSTLDGQNPELMMVKARIKEIVYRSFEGSLQDDVIYFVDQTLFTSMVSGHYYVDTRFGIFLTVVADLVVMHRQQS